MNSHSTGWTNPPKKKFNPGENPNLEIAEWAKSKSTTKITAGKIQSANLIKGKLKKIKTKQPN